MSTQSRWCSTLNLPQVIIHLIVCLSQIQPNPQCSCGDTPQKVAWHSGFQKTLFLIRQQFWCLTVYIQKLRTLSQPAQSVPAAKPHIMLWLASIRRLYHNTHHCQLILQGRFVLLHMQNPQHLSAQPAAPPAHLCLHLITSSSLKLPACPPLSHLVFC